MWNNWLQTIDTLNNRSLCSYIVAASILLAAWMQYIQHGWINPDSILYFEQARLFSNGHWAGGFQVFQWPLYGACIGFIHKISSLPIHTAAQLLNMLFFGIATASFLQLIKLAGGTNRTIFFGALLLFSAQYIVGDILEMLMRDEGFWAFYLTSLVYFIRYNQTDKLRYALLWQTCIITATLFRIEAIFYLLLLPLLYIAFCSVTIKQKIKRLFSSYSLSLIAAAIVSFILLTQPHISMAQFGRLNEIFTSDLYYQLTQRFFTRADIMSEQVLGNYLDEFAIPGLILTFLYVIGSKILTATGWLSTAIALFNIKKTVHAIPAVPRRVLSITIGIALIIAAVIITKVFVLSSRYVVALSWILLVFASFQLAALSTSPQKIMRTIFITICIVLSLSLIKNILPKRDGYNYKQNAVAWLSQKNPNHQNVFYETGRLRYYAGAPFFGGGNLNWQALIPNDHNSKAPQYDYLVINFGKRDKNKLESIREHLPNYSEVKRFYSVRKKKYCAIYQKAASNNRDYK